MCQDFLASILSQSVKPTEHRTRPALQNRSGNGTMAAFRIATSFRFTIMLFARFQILLWVVLSLACTAAHADTLAEIRARGELIWGGDAEGGGPYVYADPDDANRLIGFEADLANRLAEELGVKARFQQCDWGDLPALLHRGQIDVILNGYELTENRTERMLATRPYYVFEQVLLARKDDDSLRDWDDLRKPRSGVKQRVGVLSPSASSAYLLREFGSAIQLADYTGNTDAMRSVEVNSLDATVADLPVATFYAERFAMLKRVGLPREKGFYVAYLRSEDAALRDLLNDGIRKLLASGQLKSIYDHYGIWTETQNELTDWKPKESSSPSHKRTNWQMAWDCWGNLVHAAGLTIFLAICSMPIAIAIGLSIAIARLYGPKLVQWLCIAYVEVLRGTPLLLQLYLIYYVLPEVGIRLSPLVSAIAGLAINYSAYEAEIYRAGLLAIPRGQMEAALALGMTPGMALRRIIVPQAFRLVIPPVTNDFIALFKDTSVCSVITVVELSKRYYIDRNDTGATLELALLTGLLYLIMSIPLARLASTMERKLRSARPAVI
jgi:polar amino acid transport system substrate-binding protein